MKTNAEIEKQYEKKQEFKTICKCGHRILFYNKKKVLCNWCGTFVYKNKKVEFKDKLLKEMRKNEIYNR